MKCLVIGLGSMGKRRIRCLKALGYTDITGYDTRQDRREETREKIFDPYFTTKKDGSGLGLSIVDRIIFDHDGRIWFETKKGSGTTFFIDLPLEQ